MQALIEVVWPSGYRRRGVLSDEATATSTAGPVVLLDGFPYGAANLVAYMRLEIVRFPANSQAARAWAFKKGRAAGYRFAPRVGT